MEYYCSTKFTDLLVGVQSRLLYNCCKAYPERIDLDWLEQHPGELFHTPTQLSERTIMLQGGQCQSCTYGCYDLERQGITSVRQQNLGRTDPVIMDPRAPLQHLQIALSNDCNLTCAYCGPEWSSAWYRDISQHGAYRIGPHTVDTDNWHRLWTRMKQTARSTDTRFFELLLREIRLAPTIQSVELLGGEPMLHNELDRVVEQLQDRRVIIVSGLGIPTDRLSRWLNRFRGYPIEFHLSGESTGARFEFLRYGIRWADFQQRVQMIQDAGFDLQFSATVSNISLPGLHQFYERYHSAGAIAPSIVSDRPWLLPHMMDPDTRAQCQEQMAPWSADPRIKTILASMSQTVSESARAEVGQYIREFAQRRSIDLAFLSESFRSWAGC